MPSTQPHVPPRDRLAEMLGAQRALQERYMGVDFSFMSIERRIQYVKDMVLALSNELQAEVLNEMTWKPWTTARPAVNSERMFRELVDCWHFLMNLLWATTAGPTSPEELAQRLYEGYLAKLRINTERQETGYDGSGKCHKCTRSLDDVGVGQRPTSGSAAGEPPTGMVFICGACAAYLDAEKVLGPKIVARLLRVTSD